MEDIFVGIVAMVLGLVPLGAALLNSDWFYGLRKSQWLARRVGRGRARLFHAVIGIALISLGIALVMGFGLYRTTSRSQVNFRPLSRRIHLPRNQASNCRGTTAFIDPTAPGGGDSGGRVPP